MNITSIEAVKSRGEAIIPKLLYKLQIASGAGEHVAANSEVEVEFKLTIRGQIVLESDPQRPYVKRLEHILPPGLSFALATMRQGERALVWMDSMLALGASALPLDSGSRIPKDADLVFEVHLRSWTEEPVSSTPHFRNKLSLESFAQIEKEVESAEVLIQKGKKLQALKVLRQSLHLARRLRLDGEENPKEEKARQDLVYVITAKTMTCAYELGKYPQAVTLAKEALELQPFDAYVNYICGCSYFSLGYLDSAVRFVRKAYHCELKNKTYEKKLQEIERHQALIDKDVEYDSDREDFEEFAEYCHQRICQNEDKFRLNVSKFINRQFLRGAKTVVIGGGFRPEFLRKIADKIMQSGEQFRVINIEPDVLELSFF